MDPYPATPAAAPAGTLSAARARLEACKAEVAALEKHQREGQLVPLMQPNVGKYYRYGTTDRTPAGWQQYAKVTGIQDGSYVLAVTEDGYGPYREVWFKQRHNKPDADGAMGGDWHEISVADYRRQVDAILERARGLVG